LTKGARRVSDQEIISIVHYARKEGSQTPAPELNQFLSQHIIKRARRAGLFEAKEKQHLGYVVTVRRLSGRSKVAFHDTVRNNSAVESVAAYISRIINLAENDQAPLNCLLKRTAV
jgi:hypothetical protein